MPNPLIQSYLMFGGCCEENRRFSGLSPFIAIATEAEADRFTFIGMINMVA